jgi:hypothetical protein
MPLVRRPGLWTVQDMSRYRIVYEIDGRKQKSHTAMGSWDYCERLLRRLGYFRSETATCWIKDEKRKAHI